MRSLIEHGTSEKTGSVYVDRIMPRSHEGIVIKTHLLDSHRYTHAVHLIRNPFDAIESFFHWKKDIAGDKGLTWDDHVVGSTAAWRSHTRHWLEARCPVYTIRYEDLRLDTESSLVSLFSWLGIDLPPQKIMESIQLSSLEKMRQREPVIGKQFFRSGQIGTGVSSFTEKQRKFVITTLQDLLARCGYDEIIETGQ